MSKQRICPLKSTATILFAQFIKKSRALSEKEKRDIAINTMYCEKGNCEWWDAEFGHCIVSRIGLELHNIRQVLKERR